MMSYLVNGFLPISGCDLGEYCALEGYVWCLILRLRETRTWSVSFRGCFHGRRYFCSEQILEPSCAESLIFSRLIYLTSHISHSTKSRGVWLSKLVSQGLRQTFCVLHPNTDGVPRTKSRNASCVGKKSLNFSLIETLVEF